MTVLSYDDQVQQYHNNIVLYKGDPVFVKRIHPDLFTIVFLKNSEEKSVKFSLADFKPLDTRLGLVNIDQSVIRLTRCPVRRMSIGLSKNSAIIQTLGVPYPKDAYRTQLRVAQLNCEAIYSTIVGKFPSFDKALQRAVKTKGACAWDRQFCVSCYGDVHYKDKLVGSVSLNATSVKQIVFKEGYGYLAAIVGN